ncbi:PKD domain-containing protein [Colwellia sp. MEBiC06753]
MEINQGSAIALALVLVSLFGCNNDGDKDELNSPPVIEGATKTTASHYDQENNLSFYTSWQAKTYDNDGEIVSYQWQLLTDQSFAISGLDTQTISFSYPAGRSEQPNQMIFDLTVTDDKGAKTSQTIEHDLNDYLIVDIWPKTAKSGEEAKLPAIIWGKASRISTLSWRVSSDHNITLFDANTDTVSFIAPQVNEETEIVLMLEVVETDGISYPVGGRVVVSP